MCACTLPALPAACGLHRLAGQVASSTLPHSLRSGVAGQSLLKAAMAQRQQPSCGLQLSARAFHRTRSVKLARTIADLAGAENINPAHLAEAIQYRPRRQE